jgi:hypothetical protein
MAEYNYLRPKVSSGDMGTRKAKNGMFQNVASFSEHGGFSSASKVMAPDRPLSLEKSDLTRKGKPI